MSPQEFLASVLLILSIMALLAGLELRLPLFARAAADVGRRRINAGLTISTLVLNWALNSGAAVLALALSLEAPGAMAWVGLPMVLQVILGVAILDFGFGYLAHRLMHAMPILWRVHRPHHSDPFVDVTTTYRTHPVEVLWRYLFVVIPVWVLGIPAAAVVLHRLLSAINGLLEHANIRLWLPFDRLLSRLWVTPNMHKIHHSRDCRESDSNYGNILSIYDRVLHTFTPIDRVLSVSYGLDDADPATTASLRAVLSMPFGRRASGGQVVGEPGAAHRHAI